MAKKQLKEEKQSGGLPLWIGTFGDLMSLLLTFFILLLSMASFDSKRVQQAIGSVQGALGILEHGLETEITTPDQVQAVPLQTNSTKLDALNLFASLMNEYSEMTEISDGPGIDLEESEDGFILRIPNDILFAQGSAEISNASGRVFLERVAMEMDNFKDTLSLRIVGNTDNTPFRANSAMDNWDLSNKRALSVANVLLSLKVPASIMQVGGDADFNPVASNDTQEGRAKNRRVDLHFSFVGENKTPQAKEIIDNIKNANQGDSGTNQGANQGAIPQDSSANQNAIPQNQSMIKG